MTTLLTRENAKPGTSLALIGGLPPVRNSELGVRNGLQAKITPQSALATSVRNLELGVRNELQSKITPQSALATPHSVQLVAEQPKSANLDYLNAVGNLSPSLAAVLRPQAAYRWLLPYLAAITPQYVEGILRGALAGNHVQAWELFDLMIDSNPEIEACIGEYVDGVLERKIIVEPYRNGEQPPTPTAIRNQKIVSAAMFNMNPDPANDENEIEDTVRDILFGRFHNQSILEEDWYDTYGTGQLNRLDVDGVGQIVAPRCTFWVHPVCYAWDMNGRLGLRVALTDQIAEISRQAKQQKPGQRDFGSTPNSAFRNPHSLVEPPVWNFISSQPMPSMLTDFPRNKFLISIFKAKAGTALSASCLRSLAAWWVFENFSADYAMDMAQIFGIPFRTATFSANTSEPDKAYVREMLQNMGSRGWAMLPEGVTLNFEKAMATGSESPQGFLIKLCHEQYRKVILRQTMTGSGHGGASSGSKAGMETEGDVKEQCFNAGAKHVCKVLRNQYARHTLLVNLGDDSELPLVRMAREEDGSLEDAQRDTTLAGGGLKIGVKYLRTKYNIPEPEAGEETIGGVPPPAPGTEDRGQRTEVGKKPKPDAELNAAFNPSQLRAQDGTIAEGGGGSATPSKDSGNDSTSGPKNEILKEQNEHAKSSGTGHGGGLEESALSHVRGDASPVSPHDERHAERAQRAQAEKRRLYDWAEENDKLIPTGDTLKTDQGGGEHKVLLRGEKPVIKETRPHGELQAADPAADSALRTPHSALDYADALAETIAPLLKYLRAGLALPAEAQAHYFQRAIEQWPALTKPLQHDTAGAETLTPALVESFVAGLGAKSGKEVAMQAGDVEGHEFHGNQYVELADEKWTGTRETKTGEKTAHQFYLHRISREK